MIIPFPGTLYTILERREDQLTDILNSWVEALEDRVNIELSEDHIEDLAVILNDIIEELECI